MKTRITFNHWENGNGFTLSEDFEWADGAFTAQEWIDSCRSNGMDFPGINAKVTASVYDDGADPMFDDPISESSAWIDSEEEE